MRKSLAFYTVLVRSAVGACLLSIAPFAFASAQAAVGVDGTWEGTLGSGPRALRLRLLLTRAPDGLHLGVLESIDQGGVKIPIDAVRVAGDSIQLALRMVGASYQGVVTSDRTRLNGVWTQAGADQPLEFVRMSAPSVPTPAAPAPAASSTSPSPFGAPLIFSVLSAPVAFSSEATRHVAYELLLANWNPVSETSLSAIEVISGDSVIGRFAGADLNQMLSNPFAKDGLDNRVLGPGRSAIAFIWLDLGTASRSTQTLRHRISADGQSTEGAVVRIGNEAQVVIAPPLRGSNWVAVNGPGNSSIHRRAVLPLNGRVNLAQRFAIDWLQRGADGRSFVGNPMDNKSYLAYGSEAIAVAEGVVTAIKDGVPENAPGRRAVPITLETIGGNYVVLNLGKGRFAFYGHLQPGSLRVRPGQRVGRGAVLGLVGNSGNSSEPHLHFHISDGSAPLASDGLPYVIDAFHQRDANGAWELRRRELPLANRVVRFASEHDGR